MFRSILFSVSIIMTFSACKKEEQIDTPVSIQSPQSISSVTAGQTTGLGNVQQVNVWLESNPMWSGPINYNLHLIDANSDGIDDLKFIVAYNRSLGGASSASCGTTNIDSTLYAGYLVDGGTTVPVDSINQLFCTFASASVTFVNTPVTYTGFVNGAQNKYLIFSFCENNNKHYGWALVDIVHQQKMLIKSYCLIN
jgi:hypothetical protein